MYCVNVEKFHENGIESARMRRIWNEKSNKNEIHNTSNSMHIYSRVLYTHRRASEFIFWLSHSKQRCLGSDSIRIEDTNSKSTENRSICILRWINVFGLLIENKQKIECSKCHTERDGERDTFLWCLKTIFFTMCVSVSVRLWLIGVRSPPQ